MEETFHISIQVIVFIITFALTLIAGPIFIPALKKLKFGQTVRDDGPKSHYVKTGTPTIGGIIFLVPVLLVGLYFAKEFPQILPVMFVTFGFGIIGFIDDFIKVVKKRKDGLYPRQKLIGLLIISTLFAFYVVFYSDIGTKITIPFLGMDVGISLAPALFIPFTILLLLATTNSVNITDGLDGLASGVTLIVMVFFTVVAMTNSEWEYVKVFSSIMAGGCLGFLAFNVYPAKVFMGDTGSLALGGAVGAIAITMNLPLILLIVGAIYVLETLSVIIQVTSFKLTAKRVFKMAPLHHHFELSGWKETKIVAIFWISTILFCFIGFVALRFKFY